MSLETYISEFSKYVIAIIMALYTFECFAAFRFKNDEKRQGVYIRQNMLMFAFHFSSFMVICFETEEISYLIFYVFQQIVLYAAIVLYRSIYPSANRMIVNNMCMFLSISFVILTRLDYSKAIKQFIIAAGSLIVAILIPFFVKNIKFIKNLKWLYALIGVSALGIMMILGQTTYGSKISYSIAGVSFQPAEFVKILFVFYVASALYKSSTFFDIFTTAIVAGMHVVIQVINKDLGSALIFFIVYICMIYVASSNIIYLLLGLIGAGGASYVAFRFFTHVQVRVQAWLDPWSCIDSSGYQITQSLFGITSGGWFGLGLFKGAPKSIPFVEDDFIFSALAEELGIIFAVSLILLCLGTFIMIMRISLKLTDKFYQLVALGLGVTYLFQVFLTIGGGSKFIPLTGVTLPLISYGGTSILTTLIMFAIIEGLYMISEKEDYVPASEFVSNHSKNKSDKNRKKFDKKARSSEKSSNNNRHPKKEHGENNKAYSKNSKEKHNKKYYENESYEDEYYEDEYYEDDYYEDEYYDEYIEDEYYDEKYSEDDYYEDNNHVEKYYEDDIFDDDNSDNDEIEDEDDGLEFIHGFTVPINKNIVKEMTEIDNEDDDFPFEEIGEIYYNEEEYEKDRKKAKK